MFYLKDLIDDVEMNFTSKRAVLSYWRWVIQGKTGYPALISKFDFSELNITGKDLCFGRTTITDKSVKGYDYVYEWRLRRYQVLDEYRRSCDIREWKQEMNEVLKESYPNWRPSKKPPHQPRFRIDPVECGFKRSNASRRLPAFTRQRLEAYRNDFALDMEDDLLGFTPMKNHSKPRKLDWTYKKYKTSDTCSWKRASKNKSQWGRHMARSPEWSVREEFVRELDEERSEALVNVLERELQELNEILLSGHEEH